MYKRQEVYAVTGRTITEQNRLSRRDGPRYRCAGLLLDFRDRQILYDRIGRRVDRMLEQGLLEEAERVLSSEEDVYKRQTSTRPR